MIALGALFAVYLYSGSQDWLGTLISGYLLGMHGLFGYAIPVIFVIIGFFLILGGEIVAQVLHGHEDAFLAVVHAQGNLRVFFRMPGVFGGSMAR